MVLDVSYPAEANVRSGFQSCPIIDTGRHTHTHIHTHTHVHVYVYTYLHIWTL